MACNIPIADLQELSYDCLVSFGGISRVLISDMAETKKVELEFNPSDAFSNASETKTVTMDGSVSVAQTLQLEFPQLDKAKYEAVKSFANPNMELKVFILTKSGRMITYGEQYGCYLQTSDVASGASRSDKNRIQLTFTGDEAELAPVADDGVSTFESLISKQ